MLATIKVQLYVDKFYWWSKKEYPEKTQNCHKPMTHFILLGCIKYTEHREWGLHSLIS